MDEAVDMDEQDEHLIHERTDDRQMTATPVLLNYDQLEVEEVVEAEVQDDEQSN